MVLSMDKWIGKIAIITGASSGIGAALSERLVEHGVIVVGLARRIKNLEELAEKLGKKAGKFYPFQCDVRLETDVVKAFEWTKQNIGNVSILISNADMFDTNVLATCIATNEASKCMLENKIDGHIILISSCLAYSVISADRGVYCATKHSLRALTETLRKEFMEKNSICKIKISSVSPGLVLTEMLTSNIPKEVYETLPLLRCEDVSDAVEYILSTPPNVQVHDLIIKPIGEHF